MIMLFENAGKFLHGTISRIQSFENRTANVLSKFAEKVTKVFNRISVTIYNCIEIASRVLLHVTNLLLELYRLLPFFLIFIVHYAFEKGDREVLELFMKDILNLNPVNDKELQDERIKALWYLMKRSPNWMCKYNFDVFSLCKYLSYSVNKKAYHLKMEQYQNDKKDNITDEREFGEFRSNYSIDPINHLIEKEELQKIKKFLLNNISTKKFELEYKVVSLLVSGYSLADCVEVLGCKWSDITNFKRRIANRKKQVC
ncbi:hypothetical protein MTP04_30150 [Lysinibacillus sp. PLM2]|nr:hypothetical protein MTP04_30150 [Lysinibacillus sp. PLM2]